MDKRDSTALYERTKVNDDRHAEGKIIRERKMNALKRRRECKIGHEMPKFYKGKGTPLQP
jgi:hypothetical protein